MTMTMSKTNLQVCLSLLILVLLPAMVYADCTCNKDQAEQHNNSRSASLKYKLIAIASILISGTIGVSLPQFGRKLEAFRPESDIFFMVKAFAAGVILATGFVHILPDAFDNLTSPCLNQDLWGNFPFTGFVAMMSSIGTFMVDSFTTGYYQRLHLNHNKPQPQPLQVRINGDEERVVPQRADQAHASAIPAEETDLVRHRIISQVLELGVVIHSIIIGISLGASQNPETIKPLLAALSFHQFFEGMGLGGCISQAKFKPLSTTIMVLFFSLTTPVGIATGIAISSVYKEDSPTALTVGGVFNSAAAGILIYMALVDILAADFMNARMQGNGRLQLRANTSLLLGAACMSVLAKWA
ncbi:zinc transporter 1-like [Actinidia eriantha]|uniref:zinc transporter 1-like n=1 Tax=Actinidia eriantha TaxID=165200 RepID=UPI00258F701F|nr:zinc transporter 1-like [Actinidia eriantha]